MNMDPENVSGGGRLHEILPLLACVECRGSLHLDAGGKALHCGGCHATYPVRGGVPILLPKGMLEPGVGTVDPDDPVSRHPYSPAALEIIEKKSSEGWILDLGAGGKYRRWDRVVQIDIFRYPMTDVVCTADRLPFRDNAFHAVISQAVFEHLQYPESAAQEVRRVLQPWGIAKIDTAFLQPEHGYPHHYFNATETGLRHWFRDFDIKWGGVESYQHPQWALSWFLGVYLDRIGVSHAETLKSASVGALMHTLDALSKGQHEAADPSLIAALGALPEHMLGTLAAGVSIYAVNPEKLAAEVPGCVGSYPAQASADLARQGLVAKAREQHLEMLLCGESERARVALDRGNYLGEYYPDSRNMQQLGLRAWMQFSVAKVLRNVLPPQAWFALRQWIRGRAQVREPAPQPFVTVLVSPLQPRALIDAFFSLVHQTYSAWELIVIDRPDIPHGVRRAGRDFARLDARVQVMQAAGSWNQAVNAVVKHARGEFVIELTEGSVLAFGALAELFALARQRPHTNMVVADFERAATEDGPYMRCHAQVPDAQGFKVSSAFVARRKSAYGAAGLFVEDRAFVPNVLARHIGRLAA